MIPSLPIAHIPLSKARGAFKPCRWCEGDLGTFEAPKDTHPDFQVARVICESCGRQIAWASAKQVRQADRSRADTSSPLPTHLNGGNQ